MINLIPESAKTQVRREYLSRVAAVWMMLISVALFSAFVLLLPTQVLYTRQLTAEPQPTAEDARQQEEFDAITKTLTEANTFATQLSQSLNSLVASEILNHIEQSQSAGVTMLGFYAGREKDATRIEVRGTAQTREQLRAFQDRLKRDAFFSDAQVPVSDLAKEEDLSFTMSLTLRTQTP